MNYNSTMILGFYSNVQINGDGTEVLLKWVSYVVIHNSDFYRYAVVRCESTTIFYVNIVHYNILEM